MSEKKLRLEYKITITPSKSCDYKIVTFEILQMDESFRWNYRDKKPIFLATNGWKITSFHYPSINQFSKRIYLRGTDNTLDNDIIIFAVTKSEERFIREIKQALKEWADNFQFPDTPPKIHVSDLVQ